MSGTLGGMTGLGSNGMGAGGGMGQLPPGLLQMLMAQQGGGGGMGAQPMNQGPQIQMPQPTHMGGGGMPMGGGAPQAPQLNPASMQAAMGQGGGLAGLLAQLKGGQQGITPQPGVNAPINPNAAAGAPGAMAPSAGPPMPGQGAMPPSGMPIQPSNGSGMPFNGQGQAQGMSPGLLQMLMQHFGGGAGGQPS